MHRHLPYRLVCASLVLLGGCLHPQGVAVGPAAPDASLFPTTSTRPYRTELSQVPGPPPGDAGPQESAYRAITEAQAQCLASAHSSKANYLEQEAQALDSSPLSCLRVHAQRNRALQKAILHHSALEDRNYSAGLALEQYFHLAESEGKADLLWASLAELNQAERDVASLKARGVKLLPELEGLKDQERQIRLDVIRLEKAIEALNDRLAQLTGMEPCGRGWRFRPGVEPTPVTTTEPAAALAVAHANRPSLQLSQQLQADAGPSTLPAVHFFLQSTTGVPPTSGDVSPVGKLLSLCSGHREFPSRRAQLDRIAAENERLVTEEVCQALRNLQVQAQLAEVARKRLAEQQAKLHDLETQVAQGIISSVHLLMPRLQAHRLEADVLHEVAEWHIARIKLKQAQGLLVQECAGPHATCTAPSTVRESRRSQR